MNHREIDERVAECLGWQWSEKRQFWRAADGKRYNKYHEPLLPFFSTTGDGMLLLIEEARKQGIYLKHDFWLLGKVAIPMTQAYAISTNIWTLMAEVELNNLPLAKGYALTFLKAIGVDITPYLKCCRCDGSGFIDHGEGPLGGAEPCGCGGNGERPTKRKSNCSG
jgi:hypothetical protein